MQRMQLCNTPPARRMHVQETDGRAELGWCSALCRWSSEDSRGFARIGKAKSRTRYGFAAAGRRQTPAGAHSRVSPSHLPPATASHLPRPCCTTREVPYSTPPAVRGKGTHQAQKVWPIVHSRPRRHPWSWKRACCLSTFHNQHILHTVHRA